MCTILFSLDSADILEVPSLLFTHSRTLSNSSGGSFHGIPKSYSKTTSDIDASKSTSTTTDSKPKRILFIEKLIEIVCTNLPHFFKLGQAYFNRTLFTVREREIEKEREREEREMEREMEREREGREIEKFSFSTLIFQNMLNENQDSIISENISTKRDEFDVINYPSLHYFIMCIRK